MSGQNDINVGNTARVRYDRHEGETAKVTDISWHSNQFSSYARVYITLEGGEADERSMGALEKVSDLPLT